MLTSAFLAALSRYKVAAEALAALALLAFAVVSVHQFLEHERDIGRNEVRAEYAKQLQDAKDAATKVESDWRTKYNQAIQQGAENEKALRAAAAVSVASADSLRGTIATISDRLPGASAETARAYASTYQALFAECVGQYRAMGEKAQGHFNDAATLSAAFPAAPPKPE